MLEMLKSKLNVVVIGQGDLSTESSPLVLSNKSAFGGDSRIHDEAFASISSSHEKLSPKLTLMPQHK